MTIWTAGPMISMTFVGLAVDAWGVRSIYPTIAGTVLLVAIFISSRKTIHDLDGAINPELNQ